MTQEQERIHLLKEGIFLDTYHDFAQERSVIGDALCKKILRQYGDIDALLREYGTTHIEQKYLNKCIAFQKKYRSFSKLPFVVSCFQTRNKIKISKQLSGGVPAVRAKTRKSARLRKQPTFFSAEVFKTIKRKPTTHTRTGTITAYGTRIKIAELFGTTSDKLVMGRDSSSVLPAEKFSDYAGYAAWYDNSTSQGNKIPVNDANINYSLDKYTIDSDTIGVLQLDKVNITNNRIGKLIQGSKTIEFNKMSNRAECRPKVTNYSHAMYRILENTYHSDIAGRQYATDILLGSTCFNLLSPMAQPESLQISNAMILADAKRLGDYQQIEELVTLQYVSDEKGLIVGHVSRDKCAMGRAVLKGLNTVVSMVNKAQVISFNQPYIKSTPKQSIKKRGGEPPYNLVNLQKMVNTFKEKLKSVAYTDPLLNKYIELICLAIEYRIKYTEVNYSNYILNNTVDEIILELYEIDIIYELFKDFIAIPNELVDNDVFIEYIETLYEVCTNDSDYNSVFNDPYIRLRGYFYLQNPPSSDSTMSIADMTTYKPFIQRIEIMHHRYIASKAKEFTMSGGMFKTPYTLRSANPRPPSTAVPPRRAPAQGMRAPTTRSDRLVSAQGKPATGMSVVLRAPSQGKPATGMSVALRAPSQGKPATGMSVALRAPYDQPRSAKASQKTKNNYDRFVLLSSFEEKVRFIESLSSDPRAKKELLDKVFDSLFDETAQANFNTQAVDTEYDVTIGLYPLPDFMEVSRPITTIEKAKYIYYINVPLFPEYLDIVVLCALKYSISDSPYNNEEYEDEKEYELDTDIPMVNSSRDKKLSAIPEGSESASASEGLSSPSKGGKKSGKKSVATKEKDRKK